MTLPPPTYDLVLLLDPQAEDTTRAKLVSDARTAIEAQGELLRHDEWGNRTLTYPIDRKTTAEYHLLQFHAATPELLRSLDRSLRIADDILRFRIIKLKPGVPDAPDMLATSTVTRPAESETRSDPETETATATEPDPGTEPETPPEPEPEPQAEREVEIPPEAAIAEPS